MKPYFSLLYEREIAERIVQLRQPEQAPAVLVNTQESAPLRFRHEL